MTYPFPPLRSLPKGLLQPSQTCTHVCSLSGVWDRAHLIPPWAAAAAELCSSVCSLTHSRAFVFISSLKQTLLQQSPGEKGEHGPGRRQLCCSDLTGSDTMAGGQ